nr:unnamed protein product [Digitaria exilis]
MPAQCMDDNDNDNEHTRRRRAPVLSPPYPHRAAASPVSGGHHARPLPLAGARSYRAGDGAPAFLDRLLPSCSARISRPLILWLFSFASVMVLVGLTAYQAS